MTVVVSASAYAIMHVLLSASYLAWRHRAVILLTVLA